MELFLLTGAILFVDVYNAYDGVSFPCDCCPVVASPDSSCGETSNATRRGLPYLEQAGAS